MASLSGKAPHETWKELLKVNNDPTRNQGVTSVLQRVSDGHGTDTALAVSTTSAKVFGPLESGAITSTGNVTGLKYIGTGLDIGTAGQTPSATISTAGAIAATSISAGTGAISGGAISGTSLSAGAGTVTGGQFTGNAATVTNGVYTTSTLNVGTTAIALNRASAAQVLTGTSVDGNAGTVAGLAVHASLNNEANKIVRTDGNGYLTAGYISSSSGNEGNASSPARIWGTNGGDNFLRSYLTANLDVGITTGTWTPTFAATGQTFLYTAGQQQGYWIRVKGYVWAFFRVSFYLGQAATTAQLTLTGLPVAVTTNLVASSSISYHTFATGGFSLYPINTTTLGFYQSTLGNAFLVNQTGATNVAASGSKYLIGCIQYPV